MNKHFNLGIKFKSFEPSSSTAINIYNQYYGGFNKVSVDEANRLLEAITNVTKFRNGKLMKIVIERGKIRNGR